MTQATTTKKTTLLMIHGAAGGAWYFDNYRHYFNVHGINAIAIDLSGHGVDDVIEDYDLDDYAYDVIKAARVIDHKQLILLGHSMGGAVVLKALEKDPILCRGAILMSPPPIEGIDEDSPLGLFFGDMMAYLRKSRKEGLHDGMDLGGLLSYMMFNDRLKSDALKDVRRRLVKESSVVKTDLLKPYIHQIDRITTPIHIIGSDADRLVSIAELKSMAKVLKANLTVVSDLPHFMMLDPAWHTGADAVLKMIKGFEQV